MATERWFGRFDWSHHLSGNFEKVNARVRFSWNECAKRTASDSRLRVSKVGCMSQVMWQPWDQTSISTTGLKRTPPSLPGGLCITILRHQWEKAEKRTEGGRQRGKMGWGPWCTARAKKLPASQSVHVWPGTALRRVFWGLSKAHHSEEAVSVGMLQGCQGPVGGETRDPAWQPGHNEQENTLVFPLMFQQQSTFVPLILIPQQLYRICRCRRL